MTNNSDTSNDFAQKIAAAHKNCDTYHDFYETVTELLKANAVAPVEAGKATEEEAVWRPQEVVEAEAALLAKTEEALQFVDADAKSVVGAIFPTVLSLLKNVYDYGGEAMSDQISEDYFGGNSNIKAQYVNVYDPNMWDQL